VARPGGIDARGGTRITDARSGTHSGARVTVDTEARGSTRITVDIDGGRVLRG
jgi:hypothetical protein